jgi:hypothetical protein
LFWSPHITMSACRCGRPTVTSAWRSLLRAMEGPWSISRTGNSPSRVPLITINHSLSFTSRPPQAGTVHQGRFPLGELGAILDCRQRSVRSSSLHITYRLCIHRDTKLLEQRNYYLIEGTSPPTPCPTQSSITSSGLSQRRWVQCSAVQCSDVM